MNRLIWLSLTLILAQAHNASAASFYDLGDLDGGLTHSIAYDVSADGSTVVGQGISAAGFEAFRWTLDGEMVALGFLPVNGRTPSAAWGVSADGTVVVGESDSDSGRQAFRWTSGGEMIGLGYLPDGTRNKANDVSDDGMTVVGQSGVAAGRQAFRWTATVEPPGDGEPVYEMVGLGYISDGSYSVATAVSADGSVIVGESGTPSQREAFRWNADEGMVRLVDLSGAAAGSEDPDVPENWAWDISADGLTVVGGSQSGTEKEAFRWTSAGGMVSLGALPEGSGYSEAYAVSADGSIVVGTSNSTSGNEAFIWDAANGIRSLTAVLADDFKLDLGERTLRHALGVSADGKVIVGYDDDALPGYRPWMAVLTPPTLTSIVSGNWNDASTWDANTLIPTADNETVVRMNHRVVVAEDGEDGFASSLEINGGVAAVVIDPQKILQVVNDVQLTAGALDVTSPGKLAVGGDFTMGTMGQNTVFAAGLGPSTEPLIAAEGVVTLGPGTVLLPSAVDHLGDLDAGEWGDKTRTIITAAGGVIGEFGLQPPPNHPLGHGIFYQETVYPEVAGEVYEVSLNVFQAALGDVTGNREVGYEDLWHIFVEGGLYGVPNPEPPATWADGDVTGDGEVTYDDLWATFVTSGLYGSGPYSGKGLAGVGLTEDLTVSYTTQVEPGVQHAAITVPEPGTAALLAAGVVGLLLWRRLRRRIR